MLKPLSLLKEMPLLNSVPYLQGPLPTHPLHIKTSWQSYLLSLLMIHLMSSPQPSATCYCHHIVLHLSPRASIISILLNPTCFFSLILRGTCSTNCWLSISFYFSILLYRQTPILFRFLLGPIVFQGRVLPTYGQTTSGPIRAWVSPGHCSGSDWTYEPNWLNQIEKIYD